MVAVICAAYGMLMLLAAIMELPNSPLNAFVLFTLSAVFFRGQMMQRRSYRYVGAILATAFGILMLLRLAAIGVFSYGILGLAALPLIFRKT